MQLRIFLLIPLSLFMTSHGFAQDISFFKEAVLTASTDAQKLRALDSVISKSFRKDNDDFIAYSLEYIELAKEMDSIRLAAKKAINIQIPLTTHKKDPKQAISVINSVLVHKYKLRDSFLLGVLYLKRGKTHQKIDLKSAIEDYTLALQSFSKKDVAVTGDAYLFRGQANADSGQFIAAAEDFNDAYKVYESLKDYEYMLYAQQGNIKMYSLNGFYKKAEIERNRYITKIKELNLTKSLPLAYYNQAVDYRKNGERSLEFLALNNAKDYLDQGVVDLSTFVRVHSKLLEYHCEDNHLQTAKKHMIILDENLPKFEGDVLAMMKYLEAKSTYLAKTSKPEQGLGYAKTKLSTAESLGSGEDILDSHLLLSEIYEQTGSYKKSLFHKNEYSRFKDSVYTKTSANTLAYYQTLYETEKTEKELLEKNANIQLLEEGNASIKKFVYFIGISSVLSFGLILLYRNQRYLKENKLQQEKFSQELLVSQEKERRRISKDLHDGLGQHLLLIKNKLIDSGDGQAKQMVDKAIDEVRSISRDLHPFQLQEMGITKAIEHTLSQVDDNSSLFVSSEIDNIDNIFSPEQEVNIYRIVQETLNNILKHAEAEATRVSVKKFARYIVISIKDNGVGFDFPEKLQNLKSLGLKTLLERTKFLNGQMKVQSVRENGTTLEFQFPVK